MAEMPKIEVKDVLPFQFGEKVLIDGDLKGTVTGFIVYPHGIQVEVAWFANGVSKSAWFGLYRITRP